MKQLRQKFMQLDGKGYRALKSIQGQYKGEFFTLSIDYVQGDPFASPSRLRFFVPLNKTDISKNQFVHRHRKIAMENFFAREVAAQLYKTPPPKKGTGKSGLVFIDEPGQVNLERTAVKLKNEGIEFRLSVGMPARGRTILGKEGEKLLCTFIPEMIKKCLHDYNREVLEKSITLSDDQEIIRNFLIEHHLVAFVADGSILPRISGVSQKPLKQGLVIPFKSPDSFKVTLPLSNGKKLTGMGIPKGITLIVGGGFHGKSTLLQAIERGIYNHMLGDGREYVITDESAMKIRSEDGRRINDVDISPFINNLPFGKTTTRFFTEDASGSTSQAANIMEALETGSRLLLIDEDTSATNFMIRDERMQQLVQKEKEPITPFINRVKQLYQEKGLSTVLVIGGSGDYFKVADNVIMMDEYKPYDKTEEAKRLVKEVHQVNDHDANNLFHLHHRQLQKRKINAQLDHKEKVDCKGLQTIFLGKNRLELHGLEQLIEQSQTRAIALMIKLLIMDKAGSETMVKAINQLYERINAHGIEVISPFKDQHPGDLALPRKQELFAALNRIRY